jgi:hypothetical protein
VGSKLRRATSIESTVHTESELTVRMPHCSLALRVAECLTLVLEILRPDHSSFVLFWCFWAGHRQTGGKAVSTSAASSVGQKKTMSEGGAPMKMREVGSFSDFCCCLWCYCSGCYLITPHFPTQTIHLPSTAHRTVRRCPFDARLVSFVKRSIREMVVLLLLLLTCLLSVLFVNVWLVWVGMRRIPASG